MLGGTKPEAAGMNALLTRSETPGTLRRPVGDPSAVRRTSLSPDRLPRRAGETGGHCRRSSAEVGRGTEGQVDQRLPTGRGRSVVLRWVALRAAFERQGCCQKLRMMLSSDRPKGPSSCPVLFWMTNSAKSPVSQARQP